MANYTMEKTERDWDICYNAFKKINQRQITALMFHDQMADLFDFLGLMGFKRMHEYQYFAESAEHRTTKRYFINHHNRLLPEDGVEEIEAIPDSWYKYTRFEVSAQVRRQAVETAFEKYNEWESETKECYEKAAKELLDAGYMADYNKVNCLIEDVDMELKHIDRLIICLKSVAYNDVYVATIQDELHEKYRAMTKEICVDIC